MTTIAMNNGNGAVMIEEMDSTLRTHEGCEAKEISVEAQLRRSVMATFLNENNFYESGEEVKDRIKNLIPFCQPESVVQIILDAKEKYLLRKTPLFMVRCMLELNEFKPFVRDLLPKIITRADDILYFMEMYWSNGKIPLANSVKKAMGDSLNKFKEFHFSKFASKQDKVKFKDVLFMCHAKPKDDAQKGLFTKLIDDTLSPVERWETVIHEAESKKNAWEKLLVEKKVDNMALLMNLNQMREADVSPAIVTKAIEGMNIKGLYPYQFVTAAKYSFNPNITIALEQRMMECVKGYDKLPGKTIILVDVSGSMSNDISAKSTTTRMDVAASLAMICKEICEEVIIGTFSDKNILIANPENGFKLCHQIVTSQYHQGTQLMSSIKAFNEKFGNCDRIIVITDEQAAQERIEDPIQEKAYMINVANNQNGVGYGKWVHIDGFSSATLDWILEYEKLVKTFPVLIGI